MRRTCRGPGSPFTSISSVDRQDGLAVDAPVPQSVQGRVELVPTGLETYGGDELLLAHEPGQVSDIAPERIRPGRVDEEGLHAGSRPPAEIEEGDGGRLLRGRAVEHHDAPRRECVYRPLSPRPAHGFHDYFERTVGFVRFNDH